MSVGVTFKSASFNESFIVELGVTGVFIYCVECAVMGDMCVVNGVVGVCIEIVWLAAVGCVVDLGSAGLPFVLNLFLLMSRSCLSCCMRRYCGVVGVGGVGAL